MGNRLLETGSKWLRASADARPATREEAEDALRQLLECIGKVSDTLAHARDEATTFVMRHGVADTEGRTLTLLQQELAHLHAASPPDPMDAMKRVVAEIRAYGAEGAELRDAERVRAWQPEREYAKLAALAVAFADSLDRARRRIDAARHRRPGRPTGGVIDETAVLDAYRRLGGPKERISRAAVARELNVSESTVRRRARTWPPAMARLSDHF